MSGDRDNDVVPFDDKAVVLSGVDVAEGDAVECVSVTVELRDGRTIDITEQVRDGTAVDYLHGLGVQGVDISRTVHRLRGGLKRLEALRKARRL